MTDGADVAPTWRRHYAQLNVCKLTGADGAPVVTEGA